MAGRGVPIAQAAADLDIPDTMITISVKEIGKIPERCHRWLGRDEARAGRDHDGARHLQGSRGPHAVQAGSAELINSDGTYCARRVWCDVLAGGANCGLPFVEKLVQCQALHAWPRRRGLPKDAGERSPVADNMLDRQVTAYASNRKMGGGLRLRLDGRELAVHGRRARPVLASSRRVGRYNCITSQLLADALMCPCGSAASQRVDALLRFRLPTRQPRHQRPVAHERHSKCTSPRQRC